MDKRTPLYETHIELGGKMVSFGGYEMPVQYPAGVIKEHMAVREAVGIFDVSHMGELVIEGPDALSELNRLLANDFTNMPIGRIRYSVLCNENGGCVDDLIVYKMDEDKYLLVVNASNIAKDKHWIESHIKSRITGDVVFNDISEKVGQIAVQGPKSKELLARLTPEETLPEKYYWFTDHVNIAGVECLVSRTGYTGSFGYEVYMVAEDTKTVWDALLKEGEDLGLLPCGLGARDTLRLEAGMPLYGHEMDDETTPLEAGLDYGINMDKDDFVGKEAILAKGEPKVKRVGIKVTGRGIAREHCDIYLAGGEKIGETTSGTHCPYLGYAVAMAYVPKEYSQEGTKLEIDVRGRRIEAEIVPLPFYKL